MRHNTRAISLILALALCVCCLCACGETTAEASEEAAAVENSLSQGQWVYLNGDNIAVITSEEPVKLLLSSDAGETWSEAVMSGSRGMYVFGDWQEDVQYSGGYTGTYGSEGGYLVLTTEVVMNAQAMRIYLTEDGETWSEISNPSETHAGVLTGAGFASESVGFLSYRYYDDSGPDIWWTEDGGESWSQMEVTIPEAYQSEEYRFTPGSPTFSDSEGSYPITVLNSDTNQETTIYMSSHDGGLSWAFEASPAQDEQTEVTAQTAACCQEPYADYDAFVSEVFEGFEAEGFTNLSSESLYYSVSIPENSYFAEETDLYEDDPLQPKNRKSIFIADDGGTLVWISYLFSGDHLEKEFVTVDEFPAEYESEQLEEIYPFLSEAYECVLKEGHCVTLIKFYPLEQLETESEVSDYREKVVSFIQSYCDFLDARC